jgi:hypothetical protein
MPVLVPLDLHRRLHLTPCR